MITGQPLRVFCSYAHEDRKVWRRLANHLAPLEMQHEIELWHDDQIRPGTEWNQEIRTQLQCADIVLLLVSADYLASRYCMEFELPEAMRGHEAGAIRIVPVIVRHCDWQSTPISRLPE